MKSVRIYLTRHGQTHYNLEERMQGHIDAALTAVGEEQASALALRIKDVEIDHVYSSPLIRASRTAELINLYHHKPVSLDDRLKEMGFGSWEGLVIQDIKNDYKDRANAFWKAPETYVPIDGETFDNVQERIDQFLKDVVAMHQGETILIVCHGMLIRNMLSYLLGQDVSTVWNHPRIYQTCLTIVDYDGQNADFKVLADASHYDFSNL